VGYTQHRSNLGYVEGRCPFELLMPGKRAPAPATDALRPDQAVMLAQWQPDEFAD
jgi:hypothetical protein